jgi:LmbE family N-acetylglucosaminyl deacetylase
MLPLGLHGVPSLKVLCLGAHCDDIEIGCGGTLAVLDESVAALDVTWVVMSSTPQREQETRTAAEKLLPGAVSVAVTVHRFRDGFLPTVTAEVKERFEDLKSVQPDLVLTHFGGDAHQDHRLVSQLTWNTFRDHLVLEYEIPKYDGDLGRPNLYVPLPDAAVTRKIDTLMASFPSQLTRRWFDEETFRSLLRLRGLECNAPSRYAEAFHARKLVLA